jgi:hypothetical protein
VSDRSSREEVRNPLLKLPAAQRIQTLPPEARHALADLLLELSRDARERAHRGWRQNKAPMAAYWKAVSVYAGHLHRIARPARAGAKPGERATDPESPSKEIIR